MKYCLNCLLQVSDTNDNCANCGNTSLLKKTKYKYIYEGKIYTKINWFRKINSFYRINDNEIILRKNERLINEIYIKDIFLKNISKSTFFGLILPCVVFFVIFLISLLTLLYPSYTGNLGFEISGNFYNYMYFYTSLMFLFWLGLLVKILKKNKIYVAYKCGQARNVHINNNEYLEIVSSINKIIINKYNSKEIYFKPLVLEQYIIREFNESNVFDYLELMKNPKVCKYLVALPMKNIFEAANIIYKCRDDYHLKNIYKLAIIDIKDNKCIGYIGLSRFNLTKENCEVVYALNENYWGRGIMPIILKSFVRYLIDVEKKKNIIGTHVDKNLKSGRVMLKAGFVRDLTKDRKMIISNKEEQLIGYSYNGG